MYHESLCLSGLEKEKTRVYNPFHYQLSGRDAFRSSCVIVDATRAPNIASTPITLVASTGLPVFERGWRAAQRQRECRIISSSAASTPPHFPPCSLCPLRPLRLPECKRGGIEVDSTTTIIHAPLTLLLTTFLTFLPILLAFHAVHHAKTAHLEDTVPAARRVACFAPGAIVLTVLAADTDWVLSTHTTLACLTKAFLVRFFVPAGRAVLRAIASTSPSTFFQRLLVEIFFAAPARCFMLAG
jgi:hypothetical protein